MNDDASFLVKDHSSAIDLAAQIVAAYVSNNRVPPAEVPALLATMHAAVAGLGSATVSAEPADDLPTLSQIRKSITRGALISFIDGKPYKTLKRHLSKNGFDPASYRARYGLAADYPMTAAAYSEQRSALAKATGLGRPGPAAETAPAAAEAATSIPKPRGRKKAAAAE